MISDAVRRASTAIFAAQEKLQLVSSIMSPLQEKTTNAPTLASRAEDSAESKGAPKQGRKRKSDADKENDEPAAAGGPNKKAKQNPKASTVNKSSSTKSKASSSSSGSSSQKKAPSKKEQQAAELAKYDVSGISLPGEETDTVPIYDTCADIRTKINNHKRSAPSKLTSQAGFVREIAKCMENGNGQILESMSPRGLATFLRRKGPCGGASSPIFYASYVYFEKLRIKQNKPKSKKRQEMEEVWGKKGMKLHDSDVPMLMTRDQYISVDKYGKMDIIG